MCHIGASRRPDLVGPTADIFDPSRWDTWKPALYAYIPFNHGPRICLGRNFALMQMEYLLVRLFQVFQKVEMVGKDGNVLGGEEEEMRIKIALNTKPAEGVVLHFVK